VFGYSFFIIKQCRLQLKMLDKIPDDIVKFHIIPNLGPNRRSGLYYYLDEANYYNYDRWRELFKLRLVGHVGLHWFELAKGRYKFFLPGIMDQGCIIMSGVRIIDLESSTVTNRGLYYLTLRAPPYKLSLQNCPNITDQGLQYLRGITTLNLSNCNITDAGIKALYATNEGPKHINLLECGHITDLGLQYMNNSVEILAIGLYNDHITDEGISSVSNAKQIMILVCPEVTNKGISCLQQAIYLWLGSNDNVTIEALLALKSIKAIRINECDQVADDADLPNEDIDISEIDDPMDPDFDWD
jgi:Leucine Rich repeat